MVPGSGKPAPSLSEECDIALWHQQETLSLYGASLGNKTFRKHLGWLLTRLQARSLLTAESLLTLRSCLLANPDNAIAHNASHDIAAPYAQLTMVKSRPVGSQASTSRCRVSLPCSAVDRWAPIPLVLVLPSGSANPPLASIIGRIVRQCQQYPQIATVTVDVSASLRRAINSHSSAKRSASAL